MKNVLNVIKRIVLTILAAVFFTFVIIMTVLLLNYNNYGVSQFGNTNLILIKDDVSLGNYKAGDLVLVKSAKIENINIGDEIFTYRINNDKTVSIDIGIVGNVHEEDNAITFENGISYDMDYVAGKATKTYNKIGSYLSIVGSKWGFLFIILVPSFLIFVYEVYALVLEFKYGNNESKA